jgi:serine/threonine protein kinase
MLSGASASWKGSRGADMGDSSPNPRSPGLRDSAPGAAYKKGDVIGGKFEVYGVLGAGGFGVVYLVHWGRQTVALKTIRNELQMDEPTRDRFRREANVWVDLQRHPYLVGAYAVVEIEDALYVAMDYIAPDAHGLNSLEGHLRHRPPDLSQSLRWAIQFCYGMEYAYSKGIRCHRDIKPANIMISLDGTVKITDFGLAGVLGSSQAVSGIRLNIQDGRVGLSGQTMEGTGFGTPTHMPPEQFTDAASCDERSDIYSFGIVLFQMANGGRLPFVAPLPVSAGAEESASFWREMHRLHAQARVPELDSPVFPAVRRCLEKEPVNRYQDFTKLREDLARLLSRVAGETASAPTLTDLAAWEWTNMANDLIRLGRHEEARQCIDRALELDPNYSNAWQAKGILASGDDRMRCYDKALELDPLDSHAWRVKGQCLADLDRHKDANGCYDKALEIAPRDIAAWVSKGHSLRSLRRHAEACTCYGRAVELDPLWAGSWEWKGIGLAGMKRHEEALVCFNRAQELDPQCSYVCYHKGFALWSLNRREEALHCFNTALVDDLRNTIPKGRTFQRHILAGPYERVSQCVDRVLRRDPRNALAWFEKGACLHGLGKCEAALLCFDAALRLDSRLVQNWLGKSSCLFRLGRVDEACRCSNVYNGWSVDST